MTLRLAAAVPTGVMLELDPGVRFRGVAASRAGSVTVGPVARVRRGKPGHNDRVRSHS